MFVITQLSFRRPGQPLALQKCHVGGPRRRDLKGIRREVPGDIYLQGVQQRGPQAVLERDPEIVIQLQCLRAGLEVEGRECQTVRGGKIPGGREKHAQGDGHQGQCPRLDIPFAVQKAVDQGIAFCPLRQGIHFSFGQRRDRLLSFIRSAEGLMDVRVRKAARGFDCGLKAQQNAMLEEQDVVAEHIRPQGRKD